MKKINHLLFQIIFIVFYLLSATFVYAADDNGEMGLEVKDYPTLPFGPSLTKDSTVPEFAVYYFAFFVYIAGAVAAISFVVGAVLFIVSGDNPETASSAKDRMKGSLLGLVLTLSAFIILTTINPAFENLTVTPTPDPPSIELKTMPGVYLFTEPGCEKGAVVGPVYGSMSEMDSSIAGKVKSIKIVNSKDRGNYGVILHSLRGLTNGGGCSNPIISTDSVKCIPVNMSVNAINVFTINTATDTVAEGDGVTFFSEPFGPTRSTNSGFYKMPDSEIQNNPEFKKGASELCFDYKNAIVLPAYKRKCSGGSCNQKDLTCSATKRCTAMDEMCVNGMCVNMITRTAPDCSANGCTSFQDCPRSAQIKGEYLLGLYSEQDCTGIANCAPVYCQTFFKESLGTMNFNTQGILAAGSSKITTVYVIPIQ